MPQGNENLEKTPEQVLEIQLDAPTKDRLLKRLRELGPELGDSNHGNSQYQKNAANSLRRYRGERASSKVDKYTLLESNRDDESESERQNKKKGSNRSNFVEQFSASLIDKAHAIITKGLWEGGDLIECIPTRQGDEDQAREASIALQSILFGSKAARENLEDILKDGLLSPFATGEVKLYQPPPVVNFYRDKSIVAYEEIASDPEFKILAWSQEPELNNPQYPDGFKYNIRVERKRPTEIRVESVPVEEVIVPSVSKTIDQSRPDGPVYVARRCFMHLEQFIRQHPEKKQEILDKARTMGLTSYSDGEDNQASETYQERHDGDIYNENSQALEARGAITIYDEYLWFDLDGEGDFRLLNVVRMQDDTIIHTCEVENNPFSSWSCYRVPGALVGVSLEHRVGEYNELLTAIRRFFIYDMAYLLFPGWIYSKTAFDEEDSHKLNEMQPGATIGITTDNVQAAMMSIPRDSSDSVAGASQSIAAQLSSYASEQVGMEEALAGAENAGPGRSASGLAIAQSKGMVIFEQIARQYSHCLTGLARTTLRILIENGDQPLVVRTPNGFIEVNPSNFDGDMEIHINLTAAIAIRTQKIQDLTMILGVFEKMAGLPEKNLLFGVKNIHNLISELFSVLGYQYPERFLKDLPENVDEIAQQLEEQAGKDPKVEATLEIAREKIKAEMEKAQAEQGLKREELGLKQAQLSEESAIKVRKIMVDMTIKLHEIATEDKNDNLQIQVEAMIKLYEIEADERIAKIQAAVKEASDRAKRVATNTRPGGKKI